MNPVHERGKHKARVFAAVLGLTQRDAALLRDALLEAAATGEAVAGEATAFGRLYGLDLEVRTPVGTASLRSIWMVRSEEDFPRLVTVYVR